MKLIIKPFAFILVALLMVNCGGIKVVDAWKSPDSAKFKDKNVLVLARASNKSARTAFERDIADALIARGIKATPSFSKFPNLGELKERDEETQQLIRDILGYEGFDAVVLTSVQDVRERTTTSSNNYYNNGPWNSYYPSYYGNFNGYYNRPYAYGYGYGVTIIGDTSPTTYTTKTFYLETVAYILNKDENDQLIAVVTTKVEDPKDAYKTAEKYTEEIMKALDNQ